MCFHISAVGSGVTACSTVPNSGLTKVSGDRCSIFMITASAASCALNDLYFAVSCSAVFAAACTTSGAQVFVIALYIARHASFTCRIIADAVIWAVVLLCPVMSAPAPVHTSSAAAAHCDSGCLSAFCSLLIGALGGLAKGGTVVVFKDLFASLSKVVLLQLSVGRTGLSCWLDVCAGSVLLLLHADCWLYGCARLRSTCS